MKIYELEWQIDEDGYPLSEIKQHNSLKHIEFDANWIVKHQEKKMDAPPYWDIIYPIIIRKGDYIPPKEAITIIMTSKNIKGEVIGVSSEELEGNKILKIHFILRYPDCIYGEKINLQIFKT